MPNFVENPAAIIARHRGDSTLSSTSSFRFPASESIPYVMIMNFKEYQYNSDLIGLNNVKYENEISRGSVILPLPLQLRDSVGIEASSVSGSVAAITRTGLNFDGYQGGEDFASNARYYAQLMATVAGVAAGAASQLRGPIATAVTAALGGVSAVANQAAGTTGSLLLGQAINPFETMEFKGVKLKSHAFNWRLSPSSQRDSDALRDLIKEIKKNMLPSYVGAIGPAALAHALLKYPKLAMVTFLGIDQNYYYKLKPCMITGFEVRYNGGEQLNVFKGGKPVVVELSLEMTEVQIHTSGDYGGEGISVGPVELPAPTVDEDVGAGADALGNPEPF